MNIQKKIIGIWGYGHVGKAAAALFASQGHHIIVYDAQRIALTNSPFETTESLETLFAKADAILPSPGVDIAPYYQSYLGKWVSELDLFQACFGKPIIAITGSVGKTTITQLVVQMLRMHGWKVQAAGNIGVPMLQLLQEHNHLDAVVLELSSFQLEYTQSFAPDLAVWTNFYPNHLDRHHTIEQYFLAKYHILAYQKSMQNALVPKELQQKIEMHHPEADITYFDSNKTPTYHPWGFAQNWLIVEKALSLLQLSVLPLDQPLYLEHRMESITEIESIRFINDSKSTTPASTLAALDVLNESDRIVVLIGGLSKGIDRTSLLRKAGMKATHICCFGAEALQLFETCQRYKITASCHATLADALSFCLQKLMHVDVILLSPAGSSFDEFTNYKERGNCFKKIVLQHKKYFD